VNSTHICETDAEGNFRFDNIVPGQYSMVVRYTGYITDTIENVIVSSDKITFVYPELKEELLYAVCPIYPGPFNKKRALLVGGIQTVLVGGTLTGLHLLWYKQYSSGAFHTFNDDAEWCQMDKTGHFMSAYTIANIANRSWAISNLNYRKAAWISGLTSFGYLSTIEIMDGFSSGWGFSTSDMIANTAGCALFVSQQLFFKKQIVLPKFGFAPSPYAQMRPELLGTNFTEQLLKDYNGQTYWLSVNVASFLENDTRFPQWLNIAVGYGANGMTGGHSNPVMYNSAGNTITIERYRQLYFSLDIDLRKIPTRSPVLRFVLDTLNFIKIPAPAIEINKYGLRGHIIKF
jgi:hypothetical protein